ncbi:SIR2 family protein [Pectobacterium sp. CHL-2024]|uniref:SIR2 family protein n=1 Tax=Pectobacterium TaxID=122277 RepID=UPI001F07B3AF|nr:SIR2 family protein [Pectobacterium brasiliense]
MANEYIEKKLSNKKRTVKDLADYIKTKSGRIPNYSLFLGAGASVTSGISTAVELVNEWRREIFERLSNETLSTDESIKKWLSENERDWYDPTNEYSSLFEKKLDLPSQRRRFVEEQVDRKLPSIGYAYLVELFDCHCFDTVFTTNFDDLINEAFYQFSGERPLLCAHDSSVKGISITSSRPKIIKLHGDYLFDNIKSSLNETESLESNTKEKLIEFTKEYGLIFAGYAGNDKSIMDVINSLLKQDDYLKNGVYWCQRKSDEISPDLFNFLSKNKVYWVEIDGFDELMAELFYEITKNESLSLGTVQKSTKRDRIINGFIDDKYNLSKNEMISLELKKLKKYSLTQDISSLINELSDNENREKSDDDKIPEVEFKNLLHIDNLIKNKNYEQAEKDIEGFLEGDKNLSIKTKYIHRLINIYNDSGDVDKAVLQSEKLLKIDPYNINYSLVKSGLIKGNYEKIVFLKSLLKDFNYSVSLKNELSLIALSYLGEKKSDKNFVDFKDVECWLDESLSIDPSLDNPAWNIKQSFYVRKYEGSLETKERDDKIEELHERMSSVHPEHLRFLDLQSRYCMIKGKIEDIEEHIDKLNDIYKRKSKKNRSYLLREMSYLHYSLFGNEDRDKSISLLDNFMSNYYENSNLEVISPLLVCKAGYAISYNKNVDDAFKYALEASEAKWGTDDAEKIYDILSITDKNLDFLEGFVRNLSNDYPEPKRMRLLSDIFLLKGNFTESLDYLNKSLSEGLDYGTYMVFKTFIGLCQENYDSVITDVDNNLSYLKSISDKNALVVNREFAKKKLGRKLKETDLRSIIAYEHAKDNASMCAYFILGDDFNANKILKRKIESDYKNFYTYSRWPIIPRAALDLYVREIDKVA